MRKLFLASLVLLFTIVSSAQSFDVSKFRAGGGLVFASNVGNMGLTFNGVYQFTSEWEGAVGFSHIFENNNLRYNILDFDAHYSFFVQDSRLSFYGIGGLGFTFSKQKYPMYYHPGDQIIYPNIIDSKTNVGLNLGVGCNYKLSDDLNLAPEFRFTTSNGFYGRIGATIQYSF